MKITIEQLAEKVHEMRSAQKNYFKASRSANFSEKKIYLELSKALEREVDELASSILSKPQAEQQNLF